MQLSNTGPRSIVHCTGTACRPIERRSTRPSTPAKCDLPRRIAVRSGPVSELRIGELTSWWTFDRDGDGCVRWISAA